MIKKFFISLSVIALLFIGIHRFLSLRGGNLDAASSVALYPFLLVQKLVVHPITHWWQRRASYAELAHTLHTYMERNETLQKQVIELNGIVNYKTMTQELRFFASRYKTDKALLTQVLFKSFGDPSSKVHDKDFEQPLHFFLIDAGQNKAVVPNMVVVYKNCLVGRISEVYPYYSKVILITDKLCKVASYCSKNGVQGIHEGINDLTGTRLSFVNHLEKVEEGELVLSSGEGLIFPRGFGLGHIKKCESESFHHAIEVQPLINFATLDYCFVLQKGAELEEEKAEGKDSSSALPIPPSEIVLTS